MKNQTPAGQIFVNILNGSFHQSLLTHSNLTQSRTEITHILRIILITTIVTNVTMVTFVYKAKLMVTAAVVSVRTYLSWLLNLSLFFLINLILLTNVTVVNVVCFVTTFYKRPNT